MAANSTAASKRARELCEQFPTTPSRTLAKKLYAEFSTHYVNLESARNSIRALRGTHGGRNRADYKNKVPWTPQPAGWKPKLPPSIAEPWQPVEIDGPCRVLSLSDMHVPYHDERAIAAAIEYGQKLKPDVVVLLGDIIDFYALSRFERHPAKRNAVDEINAAKEMLGWIRSKFRTQQIYYMHGNHEVRWAIFVWNKCCELWNLEGLQFRNVLDFERFGITEVEDRPILAGKLAMLHGHELVKGIAAPVNQARGAFLRTLHSCLVGHGHRTSTHCEPDLFGREVACWSQGCLCELRPKYARTAKFNWGFAAVDVAADGQFDVQNFRISADYKVRTA